MNTPNEKLAVDPRTAIESLGLHARVTNRLRAAGIFSVAQLRNRTPGELMEIQHVGDSAVQAIVKALADAGYTLKG